MTECQCHPCNRVIKANSYTVGNSFNINTAFVDTNMSNGKCYKLILCANLPSMATIVPVILVIGGKNYPMQDHLGNNLMSDQLRTRKAYTIALGTNPNHFIMVDCVRPSAFYAVKE